MGYRLKGAKGKEHKEHAWFFTCTLSTSVIFRREKEKKKAGYAISTITENFGSIFSLMQTQEIFFYMYMQCVYCFGIPQCRILGVCPASQLLQGSLEVHSLNAWIFPISFLNVYDKTTKKKWICWCKTEKNKKTMSAHGFDSYSRPVFMYWSDK